MTDTIKSRALEAMARAIEGCESPYNSDALATAALTALHQLATAEGARLWVPVVATEGMRDAPLTVVKDGDPLPGPTGRRVFESRHDLRPWIFKTMLTAAPDPFAPEPEA